MTDDLVPVPEAMRDRRELATAKLISQDRLDRQGYEPGDFWLGRTLNGRPFGWSEDLNNLTVAGPRAGKGIGTVIPNLLMYPGSAVVIDPKGELATLTARHRRERLSQKVVVLDPAGVTDVPKNMLGTFNPLAQIDENDPAAVSSALSVAQGIVVPNPKAKEPFWDQTALSFIQAVILYMLRYYRPQDRTLMKLRETASVGDWALYQDFLQQMRSGENAQPDYQASPDKAFELLLSEMFECDAFGGILREEAAKISQMGENTRGNVLGGVRTHLDFLKEPLLWSALVENDDNPARFDLPDLRRQDRHTTVYICLPVDMMYQQGRWMRLLITMITRFMERTPFDKATELPVLMMMDEFFQLGPLPGIENTLTYAPGFGLRLWLIVQDIGQLKKNYPDSYETILGACGVKQFFGVNDLPTAKYVSELLGEEEIEVPSITLAKNHSETDGGSTSWTEGTSETSSTSDSFSTTIGDSTGSSGSNAHFGVLWHNERPHGWNSSQSSSQNTGRSTTHSTNKSSSKTDAENRSETRSSSGSYTISKQARKLFRPEEVLTSFTKTNLMQLVHVRDHGGMLLVRTPFFADIELPRLIRDDRYG